MVTAHPGKSTIVRIYRTGSNGMVRLAFRAVDPLFPALTARWATRLWFTPPAPRRRTNASAPAPGARFTVPLASPQNARSGTFAVAEAWGEGPVVYLLHGWGGWRGQLGGMVAPLVAAGHRVVALDAPGHGEAGPGRLGGRGTTFVEISEALSAVVAVAGPPHSVIAHSGGTIATALALRSGLAPQRLVFLAPMPNPLPYLEPFAQVLGLGTRSKSQIVSRAERAVGRSMSEFDISGWAAAAAGPLPQLLVIHDRLDKEVRYTDGAGLAAAWPGAALHTTEGLGHRRIVADPDVVAATVSFVTAPAQQHPGSQQLTVAGSAAGSTGRS